MKLMKKLYFLLALVFTLVRAPDHDFPDPNLKATLLAFNPLPFENPIEVDGDFEISQE